MADRYLFRGIEWDSEQFVQGFYCGCDPEKPHVNAYILNDDGRHEVDPATIGQCTGLKDKKGKLIFEGDILRYPIRNNRNFVVTWLSKDGIYRGLSTETGANTSSGRYLICISEELEKAAEIIGNIHFNPKLLEVGA